MDASAEAVSAAGGRVVDLPSPAPGDRSRTALAHDPQGAAFGLWQTRTSIGSSLVNEPGGLCFQELRSPDPAGFRTFYEKVFDYESNQVPSAGPDYPDLLLRGDVIPLAAIRAGSGADVAPPRWLPYFGVEDARTACDRATAAGGTVLLPAFDSAAGDELAKVLDPQGAELWLVTSNGTQQPDRSG